MQNRTYTAVAVLAFFALTPAAAAAPAPFSVETTEPVADIQSGQTVIPPGSDAFKIYEKGHLLVGPNERARNFIDNFTLMEDTPFIPDFAYRADTRRIYSRSLVLAEQGDSPDLAIGRVGPNGVYPYTDNPQGIPADTNLGAIYFRGWAAEGGFNNRIASISSRTAEPITRDSAAGDLRFGTTTLGSTQARTRMILDHAGGLRLQEATRTPETPKPDEGIVLYVKNGRLRLLDSSGRATDLPGWSQAATASTATHTVQREVAAPDRRVSMLQRRVKRLARQLKALRRTVLLRLRHLEVAGH